LVGLNKVQGFICPVRLVTRTCSHNAGNSTTAIQRKPANSPSAATSRHRFQDNRLTKTTETIKTAKAGETPSRPDGPYALAGRQSHMLRYARGTSVKSAALKTLDGVEAVINVQHGMTRSSRGCLQDQRHKPTRPAEHDESDCMQHLVHVFLFCF
jgi:hypothetical protein